MVIHFLGSANIQKNHKIGQKVLFIGILFYLFGGLFGSGLVEGGKNLLSRHAAEGGQMGDVGGDGKARGIGINRVFGVDNQVGIVVELKFLKCHLFPFFLRLTLQVLHHSSTIEMVTQLDGDGNGDTFFAIGILSNDGYLQNVGILHIKRSAIGLR